MNRSDIHRVSGRGADSVLRLVVNILHFILSSVQLTASPSQNICATRAARCPLARFLNTQTADCQFAVLPRQTNLISCARKHGDAIPTADLPQFSATTLLDFRSTS
jgi:hypothetical protein